MCRHGKGWMPQSSFTSASTMPLVHKSWVMRGCGQRQAGHQSSAPPGRCGSAGVPQLAAAQNKRLGRQMCPRMTRWRGSDSTVFTCCRGGREGCVK